jgi:hypothetical protein
MKYHFTEPNNCCNVRFGGASLPLVEIIADAGRASCRYWFAALAGLSDNSVASFCSGDDDNA